MPNIRQIGNRLLPPIKSNRFGEPLPWSMTLFEVESCTSSTATSSGDNSLFIPNRMAAAPIKKRKSNSIFEQISIQYFDVSRIFWSSLRLSSGDLQHRLRVTEFSDTVIQKSGKTLLLTSFGPSPLCDGLLTLMASFTPLSIYLGCQSKILTCASST